MEQPQEVEYDQCQRCQTSHPITEQLEERQCAFALYRRMRKAIKANQKLKSLHGRKVRKFLIYDNEKWRNKFNKKIRHNDTSQLDQILASYLKKIIQFETQDVHKTVCYNKQTDIVQYQYSCPRCAQAFSSTSNAYRHMKHCCYKQEHKLPKPEQSTKKTETILE